MTRPTLAGVIFACGFSAGLTIVPALLVNAALWVWHIPHVGAPFCLVALILWCWAVGRWIWRSA